MSSQAIDRRLRTVSQLRKLGLSIRKAKRVASHKELKADHRIRSRTSGTQME